MTWSKCKRIDLWIHHLICLLTIFIANKYTNKIPFILNIILLCELMSVVSGIDSVFTDQNDNIRSMYCKKIRKNIINYWRTPLWSLTIILSILSIKEKKIISASAIVGSISMLCLDRFWINKCQKVIDKYKKK